MNESLASQSKKMRKKMHRKLFKWVKESKLGTSGKSMSIKHSLNTRKLTRTLFPVESTNNIKIKISYHRDEGDGCILEKISLMNAVRVSQQVLYKWCRRCCV